MAGTVPTLLVSRRCCSPRPGRDIPCSFLCDNQCPGCTVRHPRRWSYARPLVFVIDLSALILAIKSRRGLVSLAGVAFGDPLRGTTPLFPPGIFCFSDYYFSIEEWTVGLGLWFLLQRKMHFLFFSLIAGHFGTSVTDFIEVKVIGMFVYFLC